jgi:uncharacterized protein YciI
VSFLVVMRPARDGVQDEHELLQAHWAYLQELKAGGKLVVAGPSWVGDDPYGVGVFDLKEREEVEAIVAADPAVTSGLLTPEIRPMWIVTR